MHLLLVALFIFLGPAYFTSGYPDGPPSIVNTAPAPGGGGTKGELVCVQLTPGHYSDRPRPQSGNGGYYVDAVQLSGGLRRYDPGERYSGKYYDELGKLLACTCTCT